MILLKRIESLQNPLVKHILQLKEKSRLRKKTGLFVVEGTRELSLALKGGYTITTVLVQPDIIPAERAAELLKQMDTGTEVVEIPKTVYRKLAYRTATEGVLAIGRTKDTALAGLRFRRDNPLILVAEAPEKPGNIGALLRTADAAGLDAVLIANPRTDLFNPNVIRSSLGCVFTVAVATGTTSEIIRFLKTRAIAIYGAALTGAVPYHKINFRPASAIVVGTEDEGLSGEWLHKATETVIIPMRGTIDSMNVAVSAAILIFEAIRQRGFF